MHAPRHALAVLLSLALAPACGTQEAAKDGSPTKDAPDGPRTSAAPADGGKAEGAEDGEPPPPPARKTSVSIASVQMIQNCPDPPKPAEPAKPTPPAASDTPAAAEPMPPEPPTPGAMDESMAAKVAPGAAMRGGGGGSFQQPCTQSTMQLALKTDGLAPADVEIAKVRLLHPDTAEALADIDARAPMIWTKGTYTPWGQKLAPGPEAKVSYKLSVPNWVLVERKLGKGSYGQMFVLEVSVVVAGETIVVKSPSFPREEPHVIVT